MKLAWLWIKVILLWTIVYWAWKALFLFAIGVLPSRADDTMLSKCLDAGHHVLVCRDLSFLASLVRRPNGTIAMTKGEWIQANQMLGRYSNDYCLIASSRIAVLSGSMDSSVTLQIQCEGGRPGHLVFSNLSPSPIAATIALPKTITIETPVTMTMAMTITAQAPAPITSFVTITAQVAPVTLTLPAPEPVTLTLPAPDPVTIWSQQTIVLTPDPVTITQSIYLTITAAPPPAPAPTGPSLKDILAGVDWSYGDIPVGRITGLESALKTLLADRCDGRITPATIGEGRFGLLDVFWSCEVNGRDQTRHARIKRTGELVDSGDA